MTPVPFSYSRSGRTWCEHVNQPQNEAEEEAIRRSIVRGRTVGSARWTAKVSADLDLGHTFRSRGRPKKETRP